MQWWLIGVLVGSGAAAGAILRYTLGSLLNALHPQIPMGTLAANLLGGLLMGLVVAYSASLSLEARLLLATGFLGGLTTFSTFSAETLVLLQQGRVTYALLLIGLHVMGSVLMTAIGFALVMWAKGG
ncbi:MAG: fluoride efflux transporter CrcB [Pseudomonadota bacterium]|nr:fluoride efflux transporter CrcB [Pseudomonadota bacterium]